MFSAAAADSAASVNADFDCALDALHAVAVDSKRARERQREKERVHVPLATCCGQHVPAFFGGLIRCV